MELAPTDQGRSRWLWTIARRIVLWLPAIFLWTICSAAQAVVCGEPISHKDNHWLVNLEQGGKSPQFCSGTLLSPDIVITAWHCVENGYETVDVQLDPSRESDLAGAPVRISNSDVAIVRLNHAIGDAAGEFPQLAASLPENGRFETAGWGLFTALPVPLDGLSCPKAEKGRPHRAQVSTVNQQLCRSLGATTEIDASRMLCAHGSSGEAQSLSLKNLRVFTKPGPGACEGDSGGPLLIRTNGSQPHIVGIQSAVANITSTDIVKSCAYNPALYTSVPPIFQDVAKAMLQLSTILSKPTNKMERDND